LKKAFDAPWIGISKTPRGLTMRAPVNIEIIMTAIMCVAPRPSASSVLVQRLHGDARQNSMMLFDPLGVSL
jgi:hypothetical protein